MAIVRKTFKDIVPKHIMCLMVNKMKVFIEIELMPSLYGAGNPVSLVFWLSFLALFCRLNLGPFPKNPYSICSRSFTLDCCLAIDLTELLARRS